MANQSYQQQQPQNPHLAHPSMTSPQSSAAAAAAAAYQHFQPWRNCIKTEKDPDNSGEMFYNNKQQLDMNCDPRMSHGNVGGTSAFHHQLSYPASAAVPAAAAPPPPPQHSLPPGQKLFVRESGGSNPELDLKMQQCIEEGNCVGDYAKKQIVQILDSISLLKPPERVLLYLKMPGANCETDPLRQPQNPLGARSEINHTINWVRSHLEPDPNVSIPKKDVYDDYTAFCGRNSIKPLSTADFGKVMKQVFPTVRPRRLGTRGHSRYCYAAMRKATKLDPPMLPDLTMGGGGGSGALAGGDLLTNGLSTSDLAFSPSSNSNYAEQETWPTIQSWAQRLLHVKFASAKDLADHIVKFNLVNEEAGDGHESRDTPAGSGKEATKKVKDKRKTAAASSPDKSNSPTKKRRKKRKKEEAVNVAGSGGGGSHVDDADSDSTSSAVRVKREVDSANDEDQIIDLKLPTSSGRSDGEHGISQKMPVKLMLNDVPLDASATATDSDELQIENIYCKKVRQAQQAKGLWFQQQQQTSQQQSSAGHSSVIVTPHTFSQPEIPSPSMLNQIRQQILADRESMMPKNLNKRGDGGDDSIPNDFILPRERVISLCALDKDALDDYLPLAGDNSQEAEIMQYFDENSENGQSTGGTEDSSPKVDEGQATQGVVHIDGQSEAYPMFGSDQRNMALSSAAVKQNTQNNNEGEEKLSQLRQMLHMNFQQQSPTLRPSQSAAISGPPGGPPYAGPASASLTLLSQRHNSNSIGYPSTVVGMDLTQEQTAAVAAGTRGGPVSLKKRRLPPNEEIEDAVAVQRRFVPIATPPHSQMSTAVVDYAKLSPGSGRPVEFLSPKMAAALKHQQQMQQQQQQQQMEMQMQPRASPGASPLASNNPLEGDRKTAFTRSKFNEPSPSADKTSYGVVSGQQPHDGTYGGEMKALNMSTFGESRSQSVPLNYRQSPVQVTSSNDGASWSSSYQNTNNANSSACSSVAPTPIPPDYNDFTEMMNIWENDTTTSITQRQQGVQDQSFKDKNDNNNNTQNTDDFIEEMKSYATGASNAIMSRSVPSTPVPGGVPYYPKAYCNGGPGVFQNYGQQQQLGRCYDASKSVPTTPIVSSQFRYSPVAEVMNRRDILINGNMNLEKALATASSSNFGYGDGVGDVVGANDGDMDEGPGRESARRRIEKIAQDRKGGSGGGGGADESMVKEMSPLEEEMGYDPMMDTDLMNQFKNEF